MEVMTAISRRYMNCCLKKMQVQAYLFTQPVSGYTSYRASRGSIRYLGYKWEIPLDNIVPAVIRAMMMKCCAGICCDSGGELQQ
jgi:hypothetical protein